MNGSYISKSVLVYRYGDVMMNLMNHNNWFSYYLPLVSFSRVSSEFYFALAEFIYSNKGSFLSLFRFCLVNQYLVKTTLDPSTATNIYETISNTHIRSLLLNTHIGVRAFSKGRAPLMSDLLESELFSSLHQQQIQDTCQHRNTS